MINIKDVPKTWTGNTCNNCGKQATKLILIEGDEDTDINLCTRCYNRLLKKMNVESKGV